MEEMVMKAEHISVTAGEKKIVDDCSLRVQKGEFTGVIGPNGAGKSTLLKAIRGLTAKTTGDVELFGRSEEDMSEKEIARTLAFMQQDFFAAFGFKCIDIVLSARYPYLAWWQSEDKKDHEIAERCMDFMGVLGLADKVIQEVSGGERKRVLLAKVLAQESPLIFLDEPTASLDLMYQEEIFRCCATLAKQGKTIVMICHDLTMAARWCSRLVLMAGGKIMADGKPEDVLTEGNLHRAFGLDSVVYTDPVSGELNLYTYKKASCRPNGKKILVLGDGMEACELYRLLFTAGYDVSAGMPHEHSIAAAVAANLRIPFLTGGKQEELAEKIRRSDAVLCFGTSACENELVHENAGSGTSVYADIPLSEGETISLDDMKKRIEERRL